MNEKPIERLNYFNGQRLQAADLKLEQDYHLRVRRWLNRSLYSSGIADGLIIVKVPGVPRLRIGPGLALDTLGREIILIDEHEEIVPGAHDDNNLPLALYLTIRYGEEVLARQEASCAPVNGSHRSLNKVAWGGPSRVLAEPVFEWSRDLPHESSGKVLLAYVALGKGCKEVNVLDTSLRRYVGAASASKVKQYALEGEREVAAIPTTGNPIKVTCRINFHIRGRQPNSVTLYLKARQFSALYYTELGRHSHGLTVNGSTGESNPHLNATRTSHFHPHGTLAADQESPVHTHGLSGRMGYIGNGPTDQGLAAFFLIERAWGIKLGAPENMGNIGDVGAFLVNLFGSNITPVWAPETDTSNGNDILKATNGAINGGGHGHPISGSTDNKGIDLSHTHSVSGTGTSDATGATAATDAAHQVAGTDRPALGFVYNLQIAVDGIPMTAAIVQQVARTAPSDQAPFWTMLGNGKGDHPLASERTDAIPIRIDYLPGVVLGEGEHSIECSLDLMPNGAANGGRIHYNLYVE